MSDTIIVGERNTRAASFFALALAVSLERKGMRVTRGRSALSLAKQRTGLKTNNREVLIAALRSKGEAIRDGAPFK